MITNNFRFRELKLSTQRHTYINTTCRFKYQHKDINLSTQEY